MRRERTGENRAGNDQNGAVMLSKKERENSASRTFSSDRDCRADVHFGTPQVWTYGKSLDFGAVPSIAWYHTQRR
jgi:hypothetical protein